MARKLLYCSFCGKKQKDVLRLIGSANIAAMICNECAELVVDQLAVEGIEPFHSMRGYNVIQFPKKKAPA